MGFQNSYKLFHDELKVHTIYEKLSRPIIISDSIQNPENIGSILRIAANIGALNSLFVTENDDLLSNSKIKRTASGALDKTNWKAIKTGDIQANIPLDYTVVAIETTEDAQNIYKYKFPEKTAFLIGNEVSGIRDEVIKIATQKLYIPIPGSISSLNVTHALSIALFEWWRQQTT